MNCANFRTILAIPCVEFHTTLPGLLKDLLG